MQFRRSPGVRSVDAEWHRNRQRAREQAYNGDLISQFSPEEIVKYELDTARITGRENPRMYLFNRAYDLFGQNGTDIRKLRNR